MKKSEFSEGQIVQLLKKVKARAKVAATCRKHGISDAGVLSLEETSSSVRSHRSRGT